MAARPVDEMDRACFGAGRQALDARGCALVRCMVQCPGKRARGIGRGSGMRILPVLYGFLETRLASPFWRRLTHVFERGRELRRRFRPRPTVADPLKGRFCPRPFDSFEL